MNINFNPALNFNGRIKCKGRISVERVGQHSNQPLSEAESVSLIGTTELAGVRPKRVQNTNEYVLDTSNITGIAINRIDFKSDDGKLSGLMFYNGSNPNDVEGKIKYLVALNAYNVAHQNNIETEIISCYK